MKAKGYRRESFLKSGEKIEGWEGEVLVANGNQQKKDLKIWSIIRLGNIGGFATIEYLGGIKGKERSAALGSDER